MKEMILITPRSFGKTDPVPVEKLRAAGYEVRLNPYGQIMTPEQMRDEIRDAVGIIVGVDPLHADVLGAAKKLRAISKYGVGTDNIDMDFARKNGIAVSITAGANNAAVADFAVTLMLVVSRKLVSIDRNCRNKDWTKQLGFDFSGKTLGLLGLGAIGKEVAKRARGFDVKVIAYDLFWDAPYAEKHGISYAEPEDIYACADFISVHLPLTDLTRGFIGADAFNRMKETAVLVNTARGGIVDEKALIKALREKRILGAGIDVFSQEPPPDEELYQLDNLIMGSHCAASTVGASEIMSQMAVENLLLDLR